MRSIISRRVLGGALGLLTIAAAAGAQSCRAEQRERDRQRDRDDRRFRSVSFNGWDDSDRPRLGISTGSGGMRDTLGLLVTSITPKSPAEQAGLEEGNRIASVNGTNLRLASGDVDDWEMQGIMQRRLTRELSKLKPGDEVELRVYANGQYKNVKVKTIDSEDLYPERSVYTTRSRIDDRPTLGLGLGSTGSRRDESVARRHGLQQRQPEAFGARGEGIDRDALVPRRHVADGQFSKKTDAIVQSCSIDLDPQSTQKRLLIGRYRSDDHSREIGIARQKPAHRVDKDVGALLLADAAKAADTVFSRQTAGRKKRFTINRRPVKVGVDTMMNHLRRNLQIRCCRNARGDHAVHAPHQPSADPGVMPLGRRCKDQRQRPTQRSQQQADDHFVIPPRVPDARPLP